jgi:hypothetical protein
VAGYTVWKSFMFLIVVGSAWGLLTGTKLLRGEEDAGRWELLLAGRPPGAGPSPRPSPGSPPWARPRLRDFLERFRPAGAPGAGRSRGNGPDAISWAAANSSPGVAS